MRISVDSARRELRLCDGRTVRPGDRLIELHLWNEHVACLVPYAGLNWALAARGRFRYSLGRLAERLENDVALRDVRAVMVRPGFSPRRRNTLYRLSGLLGAEPRPSQREAGLIYRCFDTLWLWLLARAFAPRNVAKGTFDFRRREEFWMSRERFLLLHRPQPVVKERSMPRRRVAV